MIQLVKFDPKFAQAAYLAAELERQWASQQWELMRIVAERDVRVGTFDLGSGSNRGAFILPPSP